MSERLIRDTNGRTVVVEGADLVRDLLSGGAQEIEEIRDEANVARAGAEDARGQAQNFSAAAAESFSAVSALANMYPTKAAGEAAVTNGYFTYVDGGNNIVYIRRVAGVSTTINPGAFINTTGTQTITGSKTFQSSQRFAMNGGRMGITDSAAPITPQALVEITNGGINTNTLRANSRWTGSTAQPYTNNDTTLFETFNKVQSDSANLSWSVSAPNAYNDIPAGVHDSGERVGVYGWATSVFIAGSYEHRGRLTSQIGVRGRAGFQSTGSPNTAVIDRANGVQGEIRADSAGATIRDARAGYFTSTINPGSGVVENNIGVYAEVSGGTAANWAWFSPAGDFYQQDRAYFGEGSFTGAQAGAAIGLRGSRANAVEFGNPDPAGFGSTLGALAGSGAPFLAFNAEATPTGNNYRTRGKPGVVITTDLAGALVFSRLPNANATSQAPSEMARFTAAGALELQATPTALGGYRVAGTQVIGPRGAAVADASGTATAAAGATPTKAEFDAVVALANSLKTSLNTALARLRTHGLIA